MKMAWQPRISGAALLLLYWSAYAALGSCAESPYPPPWPKKLSMVVAFAAGRVNGNADLALINVA